LIQNVIVGVKMNSGQTMLAIGALVLLGTLMISANSIIGGQQMRSVGTEAMITGTAVGQALVEEIIVRGFDRELQPPLFTNDSTDLVLPDSLGPDPGETTSDKFNDIDDYDRYKRTVTTPRLGDFNVICDVYYVSENSLKVESPTQTFFKRIDVKVSNQFIPTPDSTVIISKILAYRYR
jgi:hypothetical protein